MVGLMNTVAQVGGLVGSVLYGYIVTRSGSYDAPFIPMAAVLCIGAALWLMVDASEKIGQDAPRWLLARASTAGQRDVGRLFRAASMAGAEAPPYCTPADASLAGDLDRHRLGTVPQHLPADRRPAAPRPR